MLRIYLLLIFEKFTEINKIRVIEKWWIKDFRVNIFEKVIIVFTFQTEQEFQTEESFQLLLSRFDGFIQWIDLVQVLYRLWHFEGLFPILVEEIGLELGGLELVGKRKDALKLSVLQVQVMLMSLAFHAARVDNMKFIFWLSL